MITLNESFSGWAILLPDTVFMSKKENDEILHTVSKSRTLKNDPFYVLISYEDDERCYWEGGSGTSAKTVEYSFFKDDKNVLYI